MGKVPERNAIKQDLLAFALPAFLVFSAGLVASAWHLVQNQETLSLLSVRGLAGLLLVGVGLTTEFVAVGTLRGSYSSTLVVRDDHQLITHGIYRLVRHPVYLGVMMVCIGVPVFVSSPFGLLIMLALIPLILNRIRLEEKLLIEEYGDEYRAYKESTRKLVPFVY